METLSSVKSVPCELPTFLLYSGRNWKPDIPAYCSCSGQEQRGRNIRAQKEKQDKDAQGFGEKKGGCVARE